MIEQEYTCRFCNKKKGFFEMVLVRGKARASCKDCRNAKSRAWEKKNLVTASKLGIKSHPWGGRIKKRTDDGVV